MKQASCVSSWVLLLCVSSRVFGQPAAEIPPEQPADERSVPEGPEAAEPTVPAVPGPEDAQPSEGPPDGGLAARAGSPSEAAPVAESTQPDRAEDIVVTGTRIKTAFSRVAPVDVIDRKQLARTGASNLADTVQFLSAAQGAGIQGGAGLGAANASAAQINLRGLGAGTTLLLINGRRVNPTAYGTVGTFSDLSLMPLAAVERIEILKSGASAIYGADAVGGVVNVITRRNWTGALLELDGKSTQRFDLNEYTASAGIGARAERARVLATFGYFRRDQLTADERDYPPDKFRRMNGYPGAFGAGMGVMPDPACGTADAPGSIAQSTGMCSTSYRPYASLVSNAERANAFGSGDFDLTDSVTLFGEVLVSRFRGDNVTPNLAINSPYLMVPANHVDNPFGQAVSFSGSPGEGARLGTVGEDTFRGVLGLKGDFATAAKGTFWESWSWELSTTLGISRYLRTGDDNLRAPLQMALNSCSDPAVLGNCFNPFYSAVTGTGTPNSDAVIRRISGRTSELADHALQMYNAGMTGSLFELPGGELGIALGAELRHEWRVVDLDQTQNQGGYTYAGTTSDFTADRNVYSGYLELLWPLWRGIELQTAGRIERYTDTDRSAISPFAGLTLTPSEIAGRDNVPGPLRRLQVRANVSTSFRAPNISQTDPGSVGIPATLRYQDRTQVILVNYAGNPALKPQTALAWSAGLSWSPIDLLNLTADYWHYDFKDRIQPENAQKLLMDWVTAGMPSSSKVILDAGSGLVGPIYVQQVNVPGSIITSGLDFSALFRFGLGQSTEDDKRVQLSLGASGTYTFNYEVPQSQATNAKHCTGMGDQARCNVVGGRNSLPAGDPPSLPRLKMNVPLSLGYAGHSLSAMAHYFSGIEDDIPATPGGTDDGGQIPAWLSFDLQYGYSLKDVIGKELAVRVGCENLFDKQPAVVNSVDPPFASEVHDPRGRTFYARVSAEF